MVDLQVAGPNVRGRQCGSCKSCCTLVPVSLPQGQKEAGERCPHLCSKGCSIYASRPHPCQVWSCRWLFDPGTADMRRPDQAGYIVDAMPDTIITDGFPRQVLQVWVDPARPDAHRDPALRRYLASVGVATIVRWSNRRMANGLVLVPPALSDTGEWLELAGQLVCLEKMAEYKAEAGVYTPW